MRGLSERGLSVSTASTLGAGLAPGKALSRADSGSVIFKRDFERLGTDKAIRLPATLGITAPEEASTAIVIRVIATQGSDESGSRRTPGGYFFSSTTICIRRFFARPATVLLSAMGFDGP